MYDIDLNRYTEVVDSAIALRPQIEKAVDEICAQGYSNLFFIGCGGTYAHSLPMMYWLECGDGRFRHHRPTSKAAISAAGCGYGKLPPCGNAQTRRGSAVG